MNTCQKDPIKKQKIKTAVTISINDRPDLA